MLASPSKEEKCAVEEVTLRPGNRLPACVLSRTWEPSFHVVDVSDLDLPDDQLGQEIMTNYAAARTDANSAMDRLVATGRQLLLAKSRSSNFRKFLRDNCNGLSPDWAYKLIAIASGRAEEFRA